MLFCNVRQAVRLGMLCIGLGVAAGALAAGTAIKPDASRGEALFTNGDTARNIAACVACHGAAGASTITQNPKLGGQFAAYIDKQLHDFKEGKTRKNPQMSGVAALLSDQDIADVAAYLSTQKVKPGAARNAATLALGKQIYAGGIAEKNVPACASCHGPAGGGLPIRFPLLAGQHQDYQVAQLQAFRSGARSNGPMMATITARMSDAEIQAVSDYIAGLK